MISALKAASPEQITEYIHTIPLIPGSSPMVLPEAVIMPPSGVSGFSLYRSLMDKVTPFVLTKSIQGAATRVVSGELHTFHHNDFDHDKSSDEGIVGCISAETRASRLRLGLKTVDHLVYIPTNEAKRIREEAVDPEAVCISAISRGLYRIAHGIETPKTEMNSIGLLEDKVERSNDTYDEALQLLGSGSIDGEEFINRLFPSSSITVA